MRGDVLIVSAAECARRSVVVPASFHLRFPPSWRASPVQNRYADAIERQTLCWLPGSGAVAFTIRTSQAPLGVVAHRPALRARLAAAVASWPPELVAYRGGEAVRGPLLAWLAAPEGSGDRYPL